MVVTRSNLAPWIGNEASDLNCSPQGFVGAASLRGQAKGVALARHKGSSGAVRTLASPKASSVLHD